MATPLLYSNNADIKYPISDFDTNEIPTDIILDLSLTLPSNLEPAIQAIRITPYTAFVSIENKTTGDPLATAIVGEPQTAEVYPLQMEVDGFGWIVFGPGLNRDYYSGYVTAELDPECWMYLDGGFSEFSLNVNGEDQEVFNILEFLAQNSVLTITQSGDTIYVDRNDDVLRRAETSAFTDFVPLEDTYNMIRTIGGTSPDEDGNIDIVFDGCFEACEDWWDLSVPRGNTGEGENTELPLDAWMPKEQRTEQEEFCESSSSSTSSSSSSSAALDRFAGCQELIRKTILDKGNEQAIGTLYTVSD